MRIPSGTTDQYIYFVAVDATDFTTRETGLSSFTVYRSRNGGAAAAYTTPTINETDSTNMPGVYELLLDEDMTIDAGDDSQELVLHITHAGMAPVTRVVELYRPKATVGETLTVTSGLASANATQISGDATAADNLELCFDGTGYTVNANVVQVDGAAASTALSTDADIADAVLDELVSGHAVSGSLGDVIAAIATDSSATSVNTTTIAGIVTTGVAIADGTLTAAKFATNAITADKIAANAINDTKIATGAITSAKFAAGAIDAAAVATGAIDADALASDALSGIASEVVKKLGIPMTLTGASTTTSLVADDAPTGLTTTQIDDALVLHLASGSYSRVTAVSGTAPNLTLTVSPALPATPANDSQIVVFGQYLASL